ncbi:MAG: hypothetical protein R3E95_05855 [Thiolinea sp.]
MEINNYLFDFFTIIGGLVSLVAILKGMVQSGPRIAEYLRVFFSRKSKYIYTKKRIYFIEGDFNKFSDGIKLKPPRSIYKNQPKSISVYYEQTRLILRVNYGDKDLYLPYKFDVGYEHDENHEYSWEKPSNDYILAYIDINDDSLYELFFIVIDKSLDFGFDIQLNIFQYHPPANRKDLIRKENWSLIGNMKTFVNTSQVRFEIEKNKIYIISHFRGYYHEWHYVDGGFVDKGDY